MARERRPLMASSLKAECHNRATRRLRAIGHLFGAEDESQEWPEIHDAIRAARRAYQQTVCIPDFDALAILVAKRWAEALVGKVAAATPSA